MKEITKMAELQDDSRAAGNIYQTENPPAVPKLSEEDRKVYESLKNDITFVLGTSPYQKYFFSTRDS